MTREDVIIIADDEKERGESMLESDGGKYEATPLLEEVRINSGCEEQEEPKIIEAITSNNVSILTCIF